MINLLPIFPFKHTMTPCPYTAKKYRKYICLLQMALLITSGYPPFPEGHTRLLSFPGSQCRIPERGWCAIGRWGCSGRLPGRRARVRWPRCSGDPTRCRTPPPANTLNKPPFRRISGADGWAEESPARWRSACAGSRPKRSCGDRSSSSTREMPSPARSGYPIMLALSSYSVRSQFYRSRHCSCYS